MLIQPSELSHRATLAHMALIDFSGLTDAQLATMITNTVTHINAILTGAQSGTVGDSRSFSMARLPELTQLLTQLSSEQRMRGLAGGDFILGSFAEPDGGQVDAADIV